MGDRRNVYVAENDEHGVYLYTHWDGWQLPHIVAQALDRGRDRWDDAQYLARIIFCQMLDGDTDSSTGYGITARLWDHSSDPTIIVDCGRHHIRFSSAGDEKVIDATTLTFPFADFIDAYLEDDSEQT